jgi:unspecific monooxygenase
MMLSMDPPGHTRLRSIVSRAFTPKSLLRWQPIVERRAREAVDRLVEGDTADFVAAVASPFPVAVIGEILGVPEADFPLRAASRTTSSRDSRSGRRRAASRACSWT